MKEGQITPQRQELLDKLANSLDNFFKYSDTRADTAEEVAFNMVSLIEDCAPKKSEDEVAVQIEAGKSKDETIEETAKGLTALKEMYKTNLRNVSTGVALIGAGTILGMSIASPLVIGSLGAAIGAFAIAENIVSYMKGENVASAKEEEMPKKIAKIMESIATNVVGKGQLSAKEIGEALDRSFKQLERSKSQSHAAQVARRSGGQGHGR